MFHNKETRIKKIIEQIKQRIVGINCIGGNSEWLQNRLKKLEK